MKARWKRVRPTVVGGVLLTRHHSLGVEERPVGAGPNLVNDIWLEIDVEGARDVFSRAGLGEECAETGVVFAWALVGKLAIRLR